MSNLSLLRQGKIPAGTVCPFRVKCHIAAKGDCKHVGHNHPVDFSCGYARAHDIVTPNSFKMGQTAEESTAKSQT